MILAVAATEFEMSPFLASCQTGRYQSLVSGVGPVESCLRLSRYLEKYCEDISAVVNFGITGAYLGSKKNRPALLDICLAETEVLGDLGICFPRRLDDLPPELVEKKRFELDPALLHAATEILEKNGIPVWTGNFITVNCASGTEERGNILHTKYDGLCENMEGAAIARVCVEFGLPLLQVRCVSNFVEDRDPGNWLLQQACEKSGGVAALLVREIG